MFLTEFLGTNVRKALLFCKNRKPFLGSVRDRSTAVLGVGRKYLNQEIDPARKEGLEQLFDVGYQMLSPRSPELIEQCKTEICTLLTENEGEEVTDIVGYFQKKNVQRMEFFKDGSTDLSGSKVFSDVLHNPEFLDVARKYLNLKPGEKLKGKVHGWYLGSVDEAARDDSKNALMFHRDNDGTRFLKIFFYLTDCFEGDGHHEYVPGTHKFYNGYLGINRRYSFDEIKSSFKPAEVVKFVGEQGTCFAEDTMGFHRGTPIEKKNGARLIVQCFYSPEDRISFEDAKPLGV